MMNPRSRVLVSYFVGLSAGFLTGQLGGSPSLSRVALGGVVAGVVTASVFLILSRLTGDRKAA